jgi:hypothetical protein
MGVHALYVVESGDLALLSLEWRLTAGNGTT